MDLCQSNVFVNAVPGTMKNLFDFFYKLLYFQFQFLTLHLKVLSNEN